MLLLKLQKLLRITGSYFVLLLQLH